MLTHKSWSLRSFTEFYLFVPAPDQHLILLELSSPRQRLLEAPPEPILQRLQVGVNHGRDVKSHELREKQTSDDGQPKGQRDSEPAPTPRAMGSVPISAAMVVIMMGRKRMRQPW